jgi:hypothetical protein
MSQFLRYPFQRARGPRAAGGLRVIAVTAPDLSATVAVPAGAAAAGGNAVLAARSAPL